ncbi:MAG TPA: hypothetical protein VNG34_09480 [Actinomycetota bacterium]|jgi:hypothetical protein|nr:hypothetical protein [Actinomycetota bacterium]
MSSNRSSGAVGMTYFAAFMLIMIGFFHAIAGLSGILKDEFYVKTPNYLVNLDASGWGWTHLIIGIIILLAGFGLFSGAVWARTVAVIIALISAIANFVFIPVYPFWAITVIVIDVLVIWALTAHGRDVVE